jgi:hypothetical protein
MPQDKAQPHLPHNVVVEFSLPFVLRVPDSGLDLPGQQCYVLELEGVRATLCFTKKVRHLGGVVMAMEDRRGVLSYSIVRVWFDEQFFHSHPIRQSWKEEGYSLIGLSLRCLNRFLDVYRHVVGASWIHPVAGADVGQVLLRAHFADANLDALTIGNLGTGVALGSTITSEEDTGIRAFLASRHRVDDLQRLGHAVTGLFYEEDYWSAALAVEVLFEAKYARMLRLAFTSQGLTEPQVEERFQFANGHPRSITNLVTTYVPRLTALSRPDLEDDTHPVGAAFSKWSTHARDLRNQIAHGRSLVVTRQQALAAIESVRDLLAQLEPLLPDLHATSITVQDSALSEPRLAAG